MLQLSAAEARTRVEHAAMVGTRRAITGQTLAPRLPSTAAALAAGQIGSGQLRVITDDRGAARFGSDHPRDDQRVRQVPFPTWRTQPLRQPEPAGRGIHQGDMPMR
jgi:uncharacterized protein DUF222